MTDGKMILGTISVILLALFVFTGGDISKLGFGTATPVGGTSGGVSGTPISNGICPLGIDPDNTLKIGPMSKRWEPTTSVSAINARLYVNDGTGESVSDSSTSTQTAGSVAEILYGFGANGDTTYHTSYAKFNMPCKAFDSRMAGKDPQVPLLEGSDNAPHELIAYGTGNITLTVINDDNTVNAGDGAGNMTIASGGSAKFDVQEFSTADKEAFSPIVNGVVRVEANGTMYNEGVFTFGNLERYTGGVSSKLQALESTDSAVVDFVLPKCPDLTTTASRCDLDLGILYVEAESGENPTGSSGIAGASGATGLGDIKLTFFTGNYDTHTKTGKIIKGIQDDTGARSGFNPEVRWLRVD